MGVAITRSVPNPNSAGHSNAVAQAVPGTTMILPCQANARCFFQSLHGNSFSIIDFSSYTEVSGSHVNIRFDKDAMTLHHVIDYALSNQILIGTGTEPPVVVVRLRNTNFNPDLKQYLVEIQNTRGVRICVSGSDSGLSCLPRPPMTLY